jgi:hypothetical protein
LSQVSIIGPNLKTILNEFKFQCNQNQINNMQNQITNFESNFHARQGMCRFFWYVQYIVKLKWKCLRWKILTIGTAADRQQGEDHGSELKFTHLGTGNAAPLCSNWKSNRRQWVGSESSHASCCVCVWDWSRKWWALLFQNTHLYSLHRRPPCRRSPDHVGLSFE